MDETLPGEHEPAALSAGDRLRGAREAAGLSLDEVAKRTRVPLRQLTVVEQGRYDALPSPTYAIGFAKAYARAVGADEVAIAKAVRAEIASVGLRPAEYAPYELPDPARVPSRGLAIVGVGAALAVLILLALWYGTDLFRGGAGSSVPLTAPVPAATPVAAAPAPSGTPAARPTGSGTGGLAGGKVTLTADARVWLRVYDADDKTLYLGTMNPGEHFDVPADAKGPMINVGRPDKLTATLDGKPAPSLGRGDHAIKDVKVDGAAIAARLAAAGAGSTPVPSPAVPSAAAPLPTSTARAREPRPRPTRRLPLTETQRANIDAAAVPPAASGNAR